ncbi:MAG: acyl-CoA dehydrogenase family protein [Phycisphaerae bacterium]|nr:acyl-CoA dehydrogenase family protein [Phycisphaerae bacterium]
MTQSETAVFDGGLIPFGYELDEDHRMLRDTIREFAENELLPGAGERDVRGEFPREIIRALGEMGYMGLCVPEAYGGPAMDALASCIVVEELSRCDASVGVIVSVQNSLVIDPILKYATEAQKQQWLPRMARGELINCFSLSEPNSGSDAGAMECRGVWKGDHWIIQGTKCWVTTGAEADVVLLFCRTEDTERRNASAFIVDKSLPGITVGKHEEKMGIRGSSTTELVFDNVKLPADALLGERGRGLGIALSAIGGGRLGIAAQAIGIAQMALDKSVKYALQRRQFGKSISEFQAIQWKIADMATRIAASRALNYKGAWMKDHDDKRLMEIGAMAKVYASETARFCANEAVQVFGGMGYCREEGVERLYRDAKITEIYEGTSEMQRLTIAETLIANPKRLLDV